MLYVYDIVPCFAIDYVYLLVLSIPHRRGTGTTCDHQNIDQPINGLLYFPSTALITSTNSGCQRRAQRKHSAQRSKKRAPAAEIAFSVNFLHVIVLLCTSLTKNFHTSNSAGHIIRIQHEQKNDNIVALVKFQRISYSTSKISYLYLYNV